MGVTKTDDFMKFVWHAPNPSKRNRGGAEVSVVKRSECYAVTFRNKSYERLGHEFGRVEFALIGTDVMAFKTSSNGYKLCHKQKGEVTSKTFTVYISTLSAEEKNIFDGLIGDYDLQYDDTFKVHYIRRKES